MWQIVPSQFGDTERRHNIAGGIDFITKMFYNEG